MDAVIAYALEDGGLAVARERYADIPMADDVTTTFELNAAGVHKTVAVYAISYNEPDTPEPVARARFRQLAAELAAFDARVESGEVGSLGPYAADWFVTLDQPFGPDKPPVEWPWDDLDQFDFELTQAGWRTAVLDANMQPSSPIR